MCGIAGLLAAAESLPRGVLLNMAGELSHRGPDGVGMLLHGRFGMINTRLSLVDLDNGDQPLPDNAGRFWAMQNGEIYNYIELQRELAAMGHRFCTQSDTEVIACAFAEWGSGCLERFNGEFAIAVWDSEKQELFLARDRFGARPLFLAEIGGDFVFGSEIKALLRHPHAVRSVDAAGLVDCLTLWTTLPERTVFRGIRQLAPGSYLRIGARRPLTERRWWYWKFAEAQDRPPRPLPDLEEELRDLLTDACRLRLRADVPVGVYVSGGIDSSAIAALSQRIDPQLPLFALGFSDSRFDETEFQNQVACTLGVKLHRIMVNESDIARALPKVVGLTETPLLRTAPVPLLMLSGLVREVGCKAVLTGEGADEIFGGYDIFKEALIRRFWARQPSSRMRPRLLQRLYPYLGSNYAQSRPFLERFFGVDLQNTSDPLYSHRIRLNNGRRLLRFLDESVLREAALSGTPEERLCSSLPTEFAEWSALSKAQYLEASTFLSGYLLQSQGDRMLMGHSVEGRFPYLDHRVAEFAAALPVRLRIHGLQEKFILRRAMAPLLPVAVTARKKHPYRAPILRTILSDKADYVDSVTDVGYLSEAGLFRPEAVRRLLQKCRERIGGEIGELDEMALVATISTMLLHRGMIRDPVLAMPAQPTRAVVLDGRAPAVLDHGNREQLSRIAAGA